MKVRTVIVEDDRELATALEELFQEHDDFELLWMAGSGEECLSRLQGGGEMPQVALVDLGLPGMGGAALIEALKSRSPEIKCVAHTVFDDPKSVLSALQAGAEGYLLKGITGERLLESLGSLQEGGAPLTPRVARFLVSEFREVVENPLTQREQDVLECLAQGFSYQQCAERLVVSAHTVHSHVKKIYEKLAVSGRKQAVDKARKQGWLRSE